TGRAAGWNLPANNEQVREPHRRAPMSHVGDHGQTDRRPSAGPYRLGPECGFYDAAADFSPTDNPHGVWSYGWSSTLGSTFVLDLEHQVREGLDQWRGNLADDGNPAVYHNGTEHEIVLGGTALFEPGELGIHPGPDGEYAIVRWTAPA